MLNESEIAQLIEIPDITITIGLRDLGVLEVLYATGIRHAEVHKLDLYDVSSHRAAGQRPARSRRAVD